MPAKPIQMGMMPAPVGELIREEVLVPLDLSISKAARRLHLRRPTLSDIVNGKARLSLDVALRIEKAFGVSMELLLRMQTSHDVAVARSAGDKLNIERYRPA